MLWKIWLGNPWPRPFLGGFWAKWPPKYITVSFWPPKGTSTHEIESFDILTKFFRSSVRPVRWIPFLAGNPWPRPFFDLFLGLKGSKKWKIVNLKNWGKKATGNHVVWHINHLYRSNGLVCTLQKPLLYIHTYIHTYIHKQNQNRYISPYCGAETPGARATKFGKSRLLHDVVKHSMFHHNPYI